MQAALRASLASLLIKAPIKVGFDRDRAADFQWLFTNLKIAKHPRSHVLDGFFHFIEAIGVNSRVMCWEPPIPDTAHQFAQQITSDKKKCLVINPCTSARRNNFRNWRAQYYAQVANYANKHKNMHIILTGGPSSQETTMAAQICKLTEAPVTNLVGKTSIKEMLAVLAAADLIIAPDTGPAHMGTAVGTPVIGLYVTSNPYRSGPYRDLDAVVNLYPQAIENEFGKPVQKVSWGKRVRNPDAVDLITVAAVNRQIDVSLEAIL
jgi:heptosyltransferase I